MPEFFSSLMLLGSLGTGANMPFWATTNQFGLMPEGNGGVLVARAGQNYQEDKTFQYHWGVSLAGRSDVSSKIEFIPDEIYAGVRWKFLSLDLGMWHKRQDFLASDPMLGSISTTSGRISWTGNCRSMPGYSFNVLPVSISGKNRIVEIMGSWGDYRTTDLRYVQNSLLHNMQLYLRFNIKRCSITLGLDHWAEWSGVSPDYGKMPSGIGDYFRMCLGMNASPKGTVSDQLNVLGDQRGGMLLRFDYLGDGWKATFQHDIPYEDKSGMYFKNFPDGVNTLCFSFDDKNKWVTDVTYEFIYTMNQSGPLHERPATEEEKRRQSPDDPCYGYVILGGEDDYFNNEEYKSGWTAYGRTIGLPLFTPAGTRDSKWSRIGMTYGVENNRIIAHHIGLSGKLFRTVPYKLMLTYSKNYGTYRKHRKPEEYVTDWPGYNQFSAGLSFVVPLLGNKLLLLPAVYFDSGNVLPKSFGATLGLSYRIFGD